MKTATVRDLRNHYMGILKWISSGEVVQITQRGKPIARLVPEPPKTASTVDWTASAAMRRNRSLEKVLSAEESSSIIHEAGGSW
jgi:prevent-host-death family protein